MIIFMFAVIIKLNYDHNLFYEYYGVEDFWSQYFV